MHSLFIFISGLLSKLAITLCVVSVIVKAAHGKIQTDVDLNVDRLMQRDSANDIRVTSRAKPARVDTENDTHPHPFYKAKIVEDIHHSYRRYREMILVKGGTFWKGTNDPFSTTGEYPLRQVSVRNFMMDAYPVINADYWAFRAKKRFVRSEAEKKGWSWVVDLFVSERTRRHYSMVGEQGWLAVKKAKWDTPEGADSSLEDRWLHPVVHLSWHDAKKYCEFHGKRLPTEQEWEFAARAGAVNYAYPWGDNWERKRANLWQGQWPDENRAADGFKMTSPVDAYKAQNLLGFYDMIGNVWEWTSSAYVESGLGVPVDTEFIQPTLVVLKGGSHVDSIRGDINQPVRNGQRMGETQTYTASNVGFRCAKSAPIHDHRIRRPMPTNPPTPPTPAMPKRKLHRKKDEL